MYSKWFHLKPAAEKLRKSGASLRDVEKKLEIPRSTLSGWFRHVELTDKQKLRLKNRKAEALVFARKKAVEVHRAARERAIQDAQKRAQVIFESSDVRKREAVQKIALAALYLGEGFKRSAGLGLGNSDVRIVKFFVDCLRSVYGIPAEKMRCELYLRSDQSVKNEKRYWSKALKVPISRFTFASVDSRTKGKKTFVGYHGVCAVRCGAVEIEREIMYLGDLITGCLRD